MWKPQQPRWAWNTSKPLQKRSPLSRVQNIQQFHHLEPLFGALKTFGGTFKFQTFTSKYRAIFSETLEPLCSTCIWNLYVEPWGSWTFKSGTLMWSLEKPEHLRVEPSCGTLEPELFRVEPLSPAARRSLGAVAGFLRCYTGKTH